jgi:ParB-like nuclease domain
MSSSNAERAAPGVSGNGSQDDLLGGTINSPDKPSRNRTQAASRWRERYRVHPAADVFPMMSDEELQALGGDILANGLRSPILLLEDGADERFMVADGRNRLEAMERVGICDAEHLKWNCEVTYGDVFTRVISQNINRRHMTKRQIADALVALAKMKPKPKPRNDCGVSRGGRGKRNPVKAEALELNRALPSEAQVRERTIESAIARSDGREPKRYTPRPLPSPRSRMPVVGLDAARRHYLDLCAGPDVDLDAEQRVIIEAFREIAGKCISATGADLAIPDFLKRPKDAGHV